MLGRKQSVKKLSRRLHRFGDDVKFIIYTLNQGKTKRWMLAWSFMKSIVFTDIVSKKEFYRREDNFLSYMHFKEYLHCNKLQERPVTINCSKPGFIKFMQQVDLLNGTVCHREADVVVVQFRSVTWTRRRARRRAEANLISSTAKRPKCVK